MWIRTCSSPGLPESGRAGKFQLPGKNSVHLPGRATRPLRAQNSMDSSASPSAECRPRAFHAIAQPPRPAISLAPRRAAARTPPARDRERPKIRPSLVEPGLPAAFARRLQGGFVILLRLRFPERDRLDRSRRDPEQARRRARARTAPDIPPPAAPSCSASLAHPKSQDGDRLFFIEFDDLFETPQRRAFHAMGQILDQSGLLTHALEVRHAVDHGQGARTSQMYRRRCTQQAPARPSQRRRKP